MVVPEIQQLWKVMSYCMDQKYGKKLNNYILITVLISIIYFLAFLSPSLSLNDLKPVISNIMMKPTIAGLSYAGSIYVRVKT